MMKKLGGILFFSLVAVIVFTMIAGCGGGGSSTPTASPTATATATATTTPTPTPLFGFESGTVGVAPGAENSITPTVSQALVSSTRAKSGTNSVAISDTSGSVAGYFRATTTSAATGSFKASIWIPSGVDGTTYMTVWSGGNTQASNLVLDIIFNTDGTIKYRQQGSLSTQVSFTTDGTTPINWTSNAWNDIVITWTSVNTTNVCQVTINGTTAYTTSATPSSNIPTGLTGLTPDRIEIKYGTNAGTFTSSVYADDLFFF